MPKVSIIVPSYNHENFLPLRLESIFNQTFQDYEVLLLDDCSTDNSYELLQQYSKHPKVLYCLKSRTNSGNPFRQWLRGIRLAKGEFIWIAESDDLADSHLLEKLVPLLELNAKVGLVYCQSHKIDERGNLIGNMKEWTDDLDENRWGKDFINEGKDELRNYLFKRNTIPNASAVLFRKSFLPGISWVAKRFVLCGDMMLYSLILEKSKIAFKAETLNYYRFHPESIRNRTSFVKVQNEMIIWSGYLLKHKLVDSDGKIYLLQERLGGQLQYILHSPDFSVIQKCKIYQLALIYNLPLLIYILKINQVTWLKRTFFKL